MYNSKRKRLNNIALSANANTNGHTLPAAAIGTQVQAIVNPHCQKSQCTKKGRGMGCGLRRPTDLDQKNSKRLTGWISHFLGLELYQRQIDALLSSDTVMINVQRGFGKTTLCNTLCQHLEKSQKNLGGA